MGEKKSAHTRHPIEKGRLFLRESSGSGMDIPFFISVLLLLVFGLVMLYSVSYPVCYYTKGDGGYFVKRQLAFAVIGVVAMLFISRIDYHFLARKTILVGGYLGCLLLLGLVFLMPPINYARRWILIPPNQPILTFQPSEIAKIVVVLSCAYLGVLNENRIRTFHYGVSPFLALMFPIVALVLPEPHLSGTLILFALTAIMMFCSGTDFKWFAIAVGTAGALIAVILIVKPDLVPVVEDRIAMWQHPETDPTGKGMQTLQGLMAIGSGGLTGLGLGNSRQKYMYVPEPYNDSIFAIVCEELGFVGAVLILLLFVFFFVRGIYVALHARDRYGMLLTVGLISQVMLQVVLNILVVTNTVPYTGITLPFFSYGGTALVFVLAEMGLVLSVSRQAGLPR